MKVCRTCGAPMKEGPTMKVAGLKFGRHGCDLVVVQERSDGAKILARRDIAKAREEADR